jgi:RNA polymerase sigma factor (sigma-70 family)
MLELLCQLILLGYEGAAQLAKLAGLPLSAPQRLAWERDRLAAFARGEQRAFSDLYRAYAGLLYARVLLPLLKQPAAAEDVLADVFERAHGKLREVRVEDKSVFFWLARIARNRSLDMMRRRKVERLAMTKLVGGFEALALNEPSAESAASARDEEHAVAGRIRAALAKLNPRYGEAVRLRILEERSREQCASALGVSVATFDVVLLRALRAFRKAWQELSSP